MMTIVFSVLFVISKAICEFMTLKLFCSSYGLPPFASLSRFSSLLYDSILKIKIKCSILSFDSIIKL